MHWVQQIECWSDVKYRMQILMVSHKGQTCPPTDYLTSVAMARCTVDMLPLHCIFQESLYSCSECNHIIPGDKVLSITEDVLFESFTQCNLVIYLSVGWSPFLNTVHFPFNNLEIPKCNPDIVMPGYRGTGDCYVFTVTMWLNLSVDYEIMLLTHRWLSEHAFRYLTKPII